MKKLAVVLVLLIVGACGPDIKDGIVIAKHFEPAHTTIVPITHCSGGKYPVCFTNMIPIHHDDAWSVEVKNCRKECTTAWLSTTQEHWDTVALGDYVDFRTEED